MQQFMASGLDPSVIQTSFARFGDQWGEALTNMVDGIGTSKANDVFADLFTLEGKGIDTGGIVNSFRNAAPDDIPDLYNKLQQFSNLPDKISKEISFESRTTGELKDINKIWDSLETGKERKMFIKFVLDGKDIDDWVNKHGGPKGTGDKGDGSGGDNKEKKVTRGTRVIRVSQHQQHTEIQTGHQALSQHQSLQINYHTLRSCRRIGQECQTR